MLDPIDVANMESENHHYLSGRRYGPPDLLDRLRESIERMMRADQVYTYAVAYWLGALHKRERSLPQESEV